MERLEFDLLFRWFVGLGIDDPVWNHSTFSKNRNRLLDGEIAAKFLVLAQPGIRRLVSSEHFSVKPAPAKAGGTLIKAWASMKSFKPKDPPEDGTPPAGGRNAAVDFKGEKRSNATHRRTTDPDARLYRRGPRMEGKLCFIGHGLMENRCRAVCRCQAHRSIGPCRAIGRARHDRALCRPPGGDHARRGSRLRCRRVCRGIAYPQCAPARGAEHQRPSLGDRPADYPASGLRREPSHPQAHRGSVRLDQERGRDAPHQTARAGPCRLGLHLRGDCLQPGAGTQAARCSEMSCPPGRSADGRSGFAETCQI
jgi:hypothetical protein